MAITFMGMKGKLDVDLAKLVLLLITENTNALALLYLQYE